MDKKTSSYRIKLLRIMTVYSLIMLTALIFALSLPREKVTQIQNESDTPHVIQTEYVYVKIEDSTLSGSESALPEDTVYIVKEYMGKIGIFLEDGTLYRVLEVYVKTLPEADKRLLGEGIEVVGRQALSDLMQDYDE